MQLTIYENGKKKNIGQILGNKTFYKQVRKSIHLMRKIDSWGFDYRALVDYILPQADFIFIHDKEDGVYYFCNASDLGTIDADGKYIAGKNTEIRHYNRGPVDYGAQVFMARRYWQKFNKTQFDGVIDKYK